MRKLFLLAGVVAAMASCTKNDVSNVNLGNPDIITVGTYVDQATKGTIFDNTAVKESGFGIMAYYTGQSVWDNDGGFTPDFMYNQKVEYNVAANAWSYSPIKYWPNEESDKVSFFTYAPYPDGENGVNSAYTANDEAGVPQVEFTLQEDAVDMIDFVAGQKMDKERQKDVVKFNMKHQLTRATFSACTVVDNVDKGADADGDGASYVVVKSMDVKDSDEFYSEGIYTFNNISTDANKAEHGQDGTWAVSSPIAYSFATIMDDEEPLNFGGYAEKGVAIPIAQNNFTSLFADDQYLFLLPPNGADGLTDGGIQVEIVYDIVTVDSKMAKGYTATESTYTVTLPAGTLAQGKAYDYQLQFDVTEILVKANIVDWDDENQNVSGGTVDPYDKDVVNPIISLGIDANGDEEADTEATAYVGEKMLLAPLITYEDGSSLTSTDEINWSDLSGNVLTLKANKVDGTLTVSSDEPCENAIIALRSASGQKAQISLTFKAASFEVEMPETLVEGESFTPDYTINPEKEVTFTSDNQDVILVGQEGSLAAMKPGKATITATDEDGNVLGQWEIEVLAIEYDFSAEIPESIFVGESTDITWTIVPDAAVEWKSSDDFILTVDADGKLLGVGVGEATITAYDKYGEKLTSETVTVKNYGIPTIANGDGKTLQDGEKITLKVGETYKFNASGIEYETTATSTQADNAFDLMSNGNNGYTITALNVSSNPANCVEVKDPNGNVVFTLYVEVISATTIQIVSFDDSVGNQKWMTSVGQKATLTAKVTGSTDTVVWSANNDEVLTIDSATGVVTITGDGDVVVSATCDGVTATMNIKVGIVGVGELPEQGGEDLYF